MRRRTSGELFRYILVFLILIIMTTALTLLMSSCAVKDGGGPERQESKAGKTDKAPEKKARKRAKTLRLSSGTKVRLDSKGRITKKSVYRLKSGTGLTKKDLKKTGGSGRYFNIYKISKEDSVYKRINGKSYRPNPNIGLEDLAYVKTLYYDFDGKIRAGEIIVNKEIAGDVEKVFAELFRIKYQIRKMRLIDEYWEKGGRTGTGADTASMNDDNTSGFNYRMIAGTSTVSMHGYGRAIDVNPFENPWCPGGKLYPNQSASAEYANRGVRRPHMIFTDSDVTKVFRSRGFRWLGDTGTRDYQHFEK